MLALTIIRERHIFAHGIAKLNKMREGETNELKDIRGHRKPHCRLIYQQKRNIVIIAITIIKINYDSYLKHL